MKSYLLFFVLVFVCLCSSAYATFPGQNGKILYDSQWEDGPYSSNFHTVNPDGTGDTTIYHLANSGGEPTWSPDGTMIAFWSWGVGIFTMNDDGSNVTLVMPESAIGGLIARPSFSPDGSKIIFSSVYNDNNTAGIWRMNTDGTNLIRLYAGDGTSWAKYSPDGTKILIPTQWGVLVMDADGSSVTDLLTNEWFQDPETGTVSQKQYLPPDWYPLSGHSHFIFVQNDWVDNDCTSTVRRMDLDGTNLQTLTTLNHCSYSKLIWSPDGTKIVIDNAYGGTAIQMINADGSNMQEITPLPPSAYVFGGWQALPNNTNTGTNVSVTPVDLNPAPGSGTVSLAFDSITQEGDTTLTTSTQGPPPPAGFKLGTPPVYYEISTTAVFSGSATLCFSWTEGQFQNENKIKLFHNENNSWVDVTTLLNTVSNSVCGEVSSLSPFVLFENSYDFTGFFSPADNPPTRNSVKAGQAVPIKFSLNGDHGLNIFDPSYPASQQMQCDSGDPIDAIEETVNAGGSSLSYDAVSDRYTYVWKTNKAWANSCRRLTLQFNDGTVKYADFGFSK